MLQLFKTNSVLTFSLLVVYTIGLRIVNVVKPIEITTYKGGYLYQIISPYWQSSTSLNLWLATFIVILMAIYITRITNIHISTNNRSLLPGVMLVAMSSLTLLFFPISPILLGSVFAVFSLGNFLRLQSTKDTSLYHFNVGFHIGIAAMLFVPFAIFIPYLMIRQSSMSNPTLKSQVQLLTGLLVAFGLTIILAYLTDTLPLYGQLQWREGLYFIKSIHWFDDLARSIITGFFTVFILFSISNFSNLNIGRSLSVKRKISVIYEFLFLSLIITFFQSESDVISLLIIIPYLAIISGLALGSMKKLIIPELIHLLMLIVLLFLQYYIAY